MNEPTITETVEVTLTTYIPRQLNLPVQTDPATGEPWPAAGMVSQRFLDAKSLLDAGVDVRWTLPDGTPIDTDMALRLIEEHNVKIAEGYAIPNFEVSPV